MKRFILVVFALLVGASVMANPAEKMVTRLGYCAFGAIIAGYAAHDLIIYKNAKAWENLYKKQYNDKIQAELIKYLGEKYSGQKQSLLSKFLHGNMYKKAAKTFCYPRGFAPKFSFRISKQGSWNPEMVGDRHMYHGINGPNVPVTPENIKNFEEGIKAYIEWQKQKIDGAFKPFFKYIDMNELHEELKEEQFSEDNK